jgi:hypothetical protein
MAAFFTINADSFPVNDNGKLPMSYVLKYMRKYSSVISKRAQNFASDHFD